MNIADAAERQKIPIFVFISIDDIDFPDKRLITTKRDAEEDLKKRNFISVLARPSAMFPADKLEKTEGPHRNLLVDTVVSSTIKFADEAKETIPLSVDDLDPQ